MSARRPESEWKRITPHALGNDGLRWYIRAFSHIDHKFTNFILSRCLKTREPGSTGAVSNDDRLWRDHFAVAITPNPASSDSQQAVIAQDYEMKDGRAEVLVRKMLLYYFPETVAS